MTAALGSLSPEGVRWLAEEIRHVLAGHEPVLARALADALLAGWLTGAEAVLDKLPPPEPPPLVAAGLVPPPPLSPPPPPPFAGLTDPEDEPVVEFPMIEAAARSLADRRLLVKADFDALADGARRTAFTVAKVASLDALEKIRQALAEDVAGGGTLAEFQGRIDEALGKSALSPAHAELVYRNEVGKAHSEGLREILAHPLVEGELPYVRWVATHDSRVRPDHLDMEGNGIGGGPVYRRDDPLLRRLWPPIWHNCRCAVIPLTVEDAAREGVEEARRWLETGRPPERPAWVNVPASRLPEHW